MKWLIILSTCLFVQTLATLDSNTEDVFEFGHNVGRVTFSKTGNIGLFEKKIEVPISLPQCAQLTYIRVSVINNVGPPKVDFDSSNDIIQIKYRPLQHSLSRYTITAKSVPIKDCE